MGLGLLTSGESEKRNKRLTDIYLWSCLLSALGLLRLELLPVNGTDVEDR
jgi:hypothetical protein